MRKVSVALVVAAAFAVGAVPAGAGSPNQTTPGTPGQPNCEGQTTAFLAQVGKPVDAQGLGNLAKAVGLSVKEVKVVVRAFCATA